MEEEEVQTMTGKKRKSGKRRTQCGLIVLLALLLVLVVVLFAAAMVTKGFGFWSESVCTRPECVKAAAHILSHMDQSADPCNDFYQYACGNFRELHELSPGETFLDTFAVLRRQQNRRLQNLLEETNEKDHDFVLEPKNFYQSCMNQKKINELGIKPLKDYIDQNGGWAITDKNFDISGVSFGQSFETYWAKFGIETPWPGWTNKIFGIGVDADPEKKGKQIILLMQVALGAGSATLQNYLKGKDDKIMKAYATVITEIAALVGENSTNYDAAYAKAEIEKMMEFEMNLAKIMLKPSELMESRANSKVMTLGQMNKTYQPSPDKQGVNWEQLIISLFQNVNITVDSTFRVKINAEKFFESVGELITKTPKKTLFGYVMWRSIQQKLPYLDLKTRKVLLKFDLINTGDGSEIPRHKYCSKLTNGVFPLVTGRLFIDKYFPLSLQGIRDLVKNIKDAFAERLNQADWLDESSRQHAHEKLRAMNVKVGYPEFIEDSVKLSAELAKNGYRKMEPDTWFQNAIDARKKKGEKRMKGLLEPFDPLEWTEPPITVNAFQFLEGNVMTFPLGILFPPFYDMQNLESLNYGAIGATIGHEITHGFDHIGRRFDKRGGNKQWMSEESVKKFNARAKCVRDAYSSYTVEQVGEKLDGELVLGETIADIGGVVEAYIAYQRHVSKRGAEKTLPGLNLTPDQLFFTGFAQAGCGMYRDERIKLMLKGDTHPPARERILGTLYHTKEFAKAFSCPARSRMNPVHRCTVW